MQSDAFEYSAQKRARISAAYQIALNNMETDDEAEPVPAPARRRRG